MHRAYESTNAPVHVYWFDDRIEISNPGGPFGVVTQANFGEPGRVDYRNPNLAEALRVLRKDREPVVLETPSQSFRTHLFYSRLAELHGRYAVSTDANTPPAIHWRNQRKRSSCFGRCRPPRLSAAATAAPSGSPRTRSAKRSWAARERSCR